MTTVTKRFRAVDPNAPYPQNCHPRWIEVGETVSGRLAEIAVELGCVGDVEKTATDTTTEQDIAAAEASAAAARAAADTAANADDGSLHSAITQARMLKKSPGKAADGSMINYAKGAIVTGQLAIDMVSAGLAEIVS